MRRNPTPTINPQMYRHFAILTVAITALMAFFANGENQEAIAAASVGEGRVMPQPKQAKPREVAEADKSPGVWGSDESDGFGKPTTASSSGIGAWMSRPFASASAQRLPGREEERPTSEDSGDTPAELAPSAAQIAAAAAASRLRSGTRGND